MAVELEGLEAERIRESVEAIRRRISLHPRIGLVLGSGWGGVRDLLQDPVTIPLAEIPGLPRPRVRGHTGQLLFGRLGSLEIVIVAGRKHLYEGEGLGPVLYPIEVLRQLGVKILGLTNAAGAANPEFSIGDLMVIEDHLDSTWHRYNRSVGGPARRGRLGEPKRTDLRPGIYAKTSGNRKERGASRAKRGIRFHVGAFL
jgi:purine nucleoside phosphorylase